MEPSNGVGIDKPVSITVFTHEPNDSVDMVIYTADNYIIENDTLFLLSNHRVVDFFAPGYWRQAELNYGDNK